MKRYLLYVLSLIFLSGCVIPFFKSCADSAVDPAKEWKYTAQQAGGACDEAQFYADPHQTVLNEEKKIRELNPNGVLTADLEKVMQDQAASLDRWLSYQNRGDARFVDWFPGFRKGLELAEAATLYILRRLGYARTYNEFTDVVGELPPEMRPKEVNYFFPAGRKFYSMRLLYPLAPLEKISFAAEYLETAKKGGLLKLVDVFEVSSAQEFAKKLPNIYDPNDFQWKQDLRGWVVKSYKVLPDKEKPADNIVHYIEIYRKNRDLSGTESLPASRGFLAAGGSRVSVFVLDYDREGSPGFDSPDKVIRTWADVNTGRDLFANVFLRESILDSLYDQPQSNIEDRLYRRKPLEQEIYTSIVKMGEAQIDVWESGNWNVPFDYRNLTRELALEYVKPKTSEEQRKEELEKVKKIKILVRSFQNDGKKNVIEYWIPRAEYAERDISDSSATGSDTFRIRRRGKQEEVGEINYFGKYRRLIHYSYGGRWFSILDADGDGIFEKKRQIADPTGTTALISVPLVSSSDEW